MSRWVMSAGRKLARNHPLWRPFAGPLAPSSIRQSLVVVNSLFSWLVEAGYLAGNPLALTRPPALEECSAAEPTARRRVLGGRQDDDQRHAAVNAT